MKYKTYLLILLSFTLVACEDVIDVDLDQGEVLYVTDAFLTSESAPQTIQLTTTAPYFQSQEVPPLEGAQVVVRGNDGSTYVFNEQTPGVYTWTPNAGEAMDSIGTIYTLEIDYRGERFIANSRLNPVPPVDTITFEFEEAGFGQDEDGYVAEFQARDLAGRKDFYWIKAFRDNERVGDPGTFSTSENGAFGGTDADGKQFIVPVRIFFINGEDYYQLGESVRVEVWSINEEIAEFFSAVEAQTNNGGLFAVPAANVYGNILDANANAQKKMLGAFSISSVSSRTEIVRE
jgi:hypothetical protein